MPGCANSVIKFQYNHHGVILASHRCLNRSGIDRKFPQSVQRQSRLCRLGALGNEGIEIDLKKKGLYYVHNSHRCKIRDVKEISSGNHLVIADIKETIVVHRGDGSKPQTVPSSYRVQYGIVQTEDGWKLFSATIQG